MQEHEIHLRDYLRVVQKRKQAVILFFAITMAVVIIGTFSATPLYEAYTQILIEKNESGDPLLAGYAGSRFDPEFLATQYQIIKSFNVVRKVVDMLALDTKYADYFLEKKGGLASWFGGLFKTTPSKIGGIRDPQVKTTADAITEVIMEEIKIKPVRNSRVVNVSFMAKNPVLAKMVVNALAKAYMDELIAIKMNTSEQAIKWMTKKANEEKLKLEKSEKGLQRYMKAKDIVTVENKIAVVPEKLAEFSSQLSRIEARRKELEAIYERIQKTGESNLAELETLPLIAGNKALISLREQVQKAEQHVIELSKKYGPKHPAMIRAQDDLGVLRQKKDEEVRRIAKTIMKEYDLARINVTKLSALLERTKQEALNLNEKFIQYSMLKRDVDTNRALYEALLKEVKAQSVTEQVQSVNVWVAEEAMTPAHPAKPRKALNLLLGMVVGLFGGIGLAFFIEYLDNTIKTPDEAEAKLGITVLGAVELLKEKGVPVEKASIAKPQSSFAEQYRSIRSALLLSSAEHPPRTIMVTSMAPQEGKTTTATNLAMTIAQAGHKVLLIDADMRRPRVHKVLEMSNANGLSTFLAGASGADVVAEYGPGKFSVITAGPVPPNPSELLGSQRMKKLLQVLQEKFDFIVIDSAPIMGATDGLVVAKRVDGTIVVVKAGETTHEVTQAGLKSLQDIKAHVLGMVINGIDLKKHHYYRYYGYYNYAAAKEAR